MFARGGQRAVFVGGGRARTGQDAALEDEPAGVVAAGDVGVLVEVALEDGGLGRRGRLDQRPVEVRDLGGGSGGEHDEARTRGGARRDSHWRRKALTLSSLPTTSWSGRPRRSRTKMSAPPRTASSMRLRSFRLAASWSSVAPDASSRYERSSRRTRGEESRARSGGGGGAVGGERM